MKRALLSLLTILASCASDGLTPDEEWGMEGPLEPTPLPGKEDSEFRKGIAVNTDTRRTQVWSARNKWEDITTPAAMAAGPAWPANSGLNWDQKYGKWIQAMETIPTIDGFGKTFLLTTPWGKTLPSPSLECAEMSIFLRITFAAWYELPFFMEAVDGQGRRVYFGHNGVRTQAGRYAQSPEFAIRFKDLSTTPDWKTTWPKDAVLRGKRVAGGEDLQDMIAPGATFGAYLDEIHLNKRAGYFTVMALDFLGSMHLGDSANTYNIVPDAVRAGDTLIERWQREGIGHTLVVGDVRPLEGGSLDVTLISGSMPRRQGVRESGQASKSYFTSEFTGGEGEAFDGTPYAKLGGGIKRWRVTKNIGGFWTNTWMSADEASWIDSTDFARIAARPARFETILGQVPPEVARTELLAQIADKRRHLSRFPASCSARERREHAFEELYEISASAFGQTRDEVDAQFRQLEDYVFAPLEYTKSKTCCWNSSTGPMFDIVMDRARKDIKDAGGTCVAPAVFRARTDGYELWKSHATVLGRAEAWKEWSEDEPCGQKDLPSDTEAASSATPFCEVELTGTLPTCTDAREPNNGRVDAKDVTGTIAGLKICAADDDWFRIPTAGDVKIEFRSIDGDLEMEAFDANGVLVDTSNNSNNDEEVTVPAGGFVRVFGFNGARNNSYQLTAP